MLRTAGLRINHKRTGFLPRCAAGRACCLLWNLSARRSLSYTRGRHRRFPGLPAKPITCFPFHEIIRDEQMLMTWHVSNFHPLRIAVTYLSLFAPDCSCLLDKLSRKTTAGVVAGRGPFHILRGGPTRARRHLSVPRVASTRLDSKYLHRVFFFLPRSTSTPSLPRVAETTYCPSQERVA